MTGIPPLDWAAGDPRVLRRVYAAQRTPLARAIPPEVKVVDEDRPGLPGLRFVPDRAEGAPILYFHGGGWMVGSPETHAALTAALARATRREVVSVRYALAPERAWPAQHADAVARVEAAVAAWGPTVLAGDSAGAAMALWGESGAPPEIRSQIRGIVAFYGAFGLTDGASMRRYGTVESGLSARDLRAMYGRLGVGDPARLRAAIAPEGAPLYLLAAGADPLADDTAWAAEALAPRGTRLAVAEGAPHGFLHGALADAAIADHLTAAAAWLDTLPDDGAGAAD
ncbi:MAG: alpha/beta hydrolase fold domain-containing protein [Shimia sp.]